MSPTGYRQPLPTVNCPYCTLLLEYPPDAHIIRCPVCSGTSMLQVMQQLHMPCRKCYCTLSYFPHYALLQCPQCHLQQAPPTMPASPHTAQTAPHPINTVQRQPSTDSSHTYPGTYAVMPTQKPTVQPRAAQAPATNSAAPQQPQSYQPPVQRADPRSAMQPTTPVASAPRLSVPDTKPRSKSVSSQPAPPVTAAAAPSPSASFTSSAPDTVLPPKPVKSTPPATPSSSSSSSSKRSKSPKLTELLSAVHITAPPPPLRLSLSANSRHSKGDSADLNQSTPVVGDYSARSSTGDARHEEDRKVNPPVPGARLTPSSSGAAGALSRLNPVGSHAVNDGNGRFEPLAEESTVEYSRWDGGEQSVYRREQEEEEEVEAVEGVEPGAGEGAAFGGRQNVYSPTSMSRQVSASVYRND